MNETFYKQKCQDAVLDDIADMLEDDLPNIIIAMDVMSTVNYGKTYKIVFRLMKPFKGIIIAVYDKVKKEVIVDYYKSLGKSIISDSMPVFIQGDEILLQNDVNVYPTATRAMNEKDHKHTYTKGTKVYVYRCHDSGMINITDDKTKAGGWTNPKYVTI